MTALVDIQPRRVLCYFAKIAVGLDDECWPWLGPVDRKGYGIFRLSPQQTSKAHLFSFVLHHGPIPTGMQVDHECDNPRCQNPRCLRAMTGVDNNARSTSPSAVNARKTACIHGHDFDVANTIFDKHGHRRCRACAVARGIAA